MALIKLFYFIILLGNTIGDLELERTLESPLCCQEKEGIPELVNIEFNSQIVNNEYIVTFNGYYKHKARANYINAALNGSGVHNWKILERQNPASDFPSDFDVVLLEDTEKLGGLDALNDHPSVKHVTSQRMVHRTLKFVANASDPESTFCIGASCNSWKFIRRGRNSLSFNPIWQATARHTSRRLLRAVPKQITTVLQADVLWNLGITGTYLYNLSQLYRYFIILFHKL